MIKYIAIIFALFVGLATSSAFAVPMDVVIWDSSASTPKTKQTALVARHFFHKFAKPAGLFSESRDLALLDTANSEIIYSGPAARMNDPMVAQHIMAMAAHQSGCNDVGRAVNAAAGILEGLSGDDIRRSTVTIFSTGVVVPAPCDGARVKSNVPPAVDFSPLPKHVRVEAWWLVQDQYHQWQKLFANQKVANSELYAQPRVLLELGIDQ